MWLVTNWTRVTKHFLYPVTRVHRDTGQNKLFAVPPWLIGHVSPKLVQCDSSQYRHVSQQIFNSTTDWHFDTCHSKIVQCSTFLENLVQYETSKNGHVSETDLYKMVRGQMETCQHVFELNGTCGKSDVSDQQFYSKRDVKMDTCQMVLYGVTRFKLNTCRNHFVQFDKCHNVRGS